MQRNTKVINFIGGPGCGKSSSTAQLFSEMKWAGKEVEIINEYAKELTWLGHHNLLQDQLWVSANQNQRIHRLIGQVDYIITDSPLFLCLAYIPSHYPSSFSTFMMDLWNSYDNINIVLQRKKDYNPNGRNQTVEEAVLLDSRIMDIMDKHDIPAHHTIEGTSEGVHSLMKIL